MYTCPHSTPSPGAIPTVHDFPEVGVPGTTGSSEDSNTESPTSTPPEAPGLSELSFHVTHPVSRHTYVQCSTMYTNEQGLCADENYHQTNNGQQKGQRMSC